MDVVKAFNSEPPISKKKMVDITKSAMKAIKFYKHVVMGVEKFIQKCKSEYKIPGLYVIDSIVRQSRHQFGGEKDVFGPRFAVNMMTTIKHLLHCPEEEKPKIVRVLNLWKKNQVMEEEAIAPMLRFCEEQGLEVEAIQVEKTVKGDAANPLLYGKAAIDSPIKEATTPPPRTADTIDLTPKVERELVGPLTVITERDMAEALRSAGLDPAYASDPVVLAQMQQLTNTLLLTQQEQEQQRQGSIKNLLSQDYDYSDESGDEESPKKGPPPPPPKIMPSITKKNIAAAAKDLLKDPSVIAQIQQLQQQRMGHQQQQLGLRQSVQGPPPMLPPMMSGHLQQQHHHHGGAPHQSLPPPFLPPHFSGPPPMAFPPPMPTATIHRDLGAMNAMGAGDRSPVDDRSDRRSSSKRKHRDRSKSPSRERDRDRHKKRSRRSRSGDRDEHRGRDDRRSRDADDNGRSRHSKHSSHSRSSQERERKKLGLPTAPKDGHVMIASRTVWFGRLPPNCPDDAIKTALVEMGEPERINVIQSRACAYVTMPDRKSAFKIIDKMQNLVIAKKAVKLAWAKNNGVQDDKYGLFWDGDRGVAQIPYEHLPKELSRILEDGHLDVDTLPHHLKGLYTEKGKVESQDSVLNSSALSDASVASAMAAFSAFPFVAPPGSAGFPFPPPFMAGMPPPMPGMMPPMGAPPSTADIPLPGQSLPMPSAPMMHHQPPSMLGQQQPPQPQQQMVPPQQQPPMRFPPPIQPQGRMPPPAAFANAERPQGPPDQHFPHHHQAEPSWSQSGPPGGFSGRGGRGFRGGAFRGGPPDRGGFFGGRGFGPPRGGFRGGRDNFGGGSGDWNQGHDQHNGGMRGGRGGGRFNGGGPPMMRGGAGGGGRGFRGGGGSRWGEPTPNEDSALPPGVDEQHDQEPQSEEAVMLQAMGLPDGFGGEKGGPTWAAHAQSPLEVPGEQE